MQDLIKNIEQYLNTGFEEKLFSASVAYLQNTSDPLRANSFCYSLRELIRHVFERRAPNDEIIKCSWFKPETDNGLPSRRQKYTYCVQGGLEPTFVENELKLDVLEPWKSIKGSIDTLSKYTHVGKDTFDISDIKVSAIAKEALESLLTIFHMINDTKVELHHSLSSHIDNELLNTFVMNSMSDIDCLSQSSYVEQSEVHEYSLSEIDYEKLLFEGNGTAYVSLNYGKKDDACEINTDFPFKFQGHSHINKPYDLSISAEDIDIDIRSWYE
ncbi:MAG: hypothetical protein V3U87_02060 [Methylococcaceae bacterium]